MATWLGVLALVVNLMAGALVPAAALARPAGAGQLALPICTAEGVRLLVVDQAPDDDSDPAVPAAGPHCLLCLAAARVAILPAQACPVPRPRLAAHQPRAPPGWLLPPALHPRGGHAARAPPIA